MVKTVLLCLNYTVFGGGVIFLDLSSIATLNLLDLCSGYLVVAEEKLCDGFDFLVVKDLLVPITSHHQDSHQHQEQTHHTYLHTGNCTWRKSVQLYVSIGKTMVELCKSIHTVHNGMERGQ